MSYQDVEHPLPFHICNMYSFTYHVSFEAKCDTKENKKAQDVSLKKTELSDGE